MSNCHEIIERLENLAKHAVHYVGEPPFVMSLDDGIALHDAINLLKAQEARVMTLEEVIHSEDWIWYQWKNTHCGWTIAVDCDEEWIGWEDLTVDQLCKYGKKWRCWTSRPTPEQMRDTPWEGEKE